MSKVEVKPKKRKKKKRTLRRRVVHEDGEWTLVVVEDVLGRLGAGAGVGGSLWHHLIRAKTKTR